MKLDTKSRIFQKVEELKSLPCRTLEDKVTLEREFRDCILEEFALENENSCNDCGLKAVIQGLVPDLTHQCIDTTVCAVRKDLITYLRNNPIYFREYNNFGDTDQIDLFEQSLNRYCCLLEESNQPIGNFEFNLLSEVLQTPIHVYSYESCDTFGHQHPKEGVHLYHDPLRSHYYPMRLH